MTPSLKRSTWQRPTARAIWCDWFCKALRLKCPVSKRGSYRRARNWHLLLPLRPATGRDCPCTPGGPPHSSETSPYETAHIQLGVRNQVDGLLSYRRGQPNGL